MALNRDACLALPCSHIHCFPRLLGGYKLLMETGTHSIETRRGRKKA